MRELEEILRAARGEAAVDLLFTGGRLVNVLSGEIYREEIAVHRGRIVGFGPYRARRKISVRGGYLLPGFIDGHIHLESTMLSVREFCRAVSPHGTTSVVVDPHEIANVFGMDGIRYMMESAKYQPVNIFLMLPSCVPSAGPEWETSGSRLTSEDLAPFLDQKWVVGLAEVMDYPGVVQGRPDVLEKLAQADGKPIDGHAPGLSGRPLNAYVAAGISSDHECTELSEAREKLRKGMMVMIREGTAARNLEALLPLVNERNHRRFCLVSDDRHPQDLWREGHLDELLRRARRRGLSPAVAVSLVTINPARHFRLPRLGALAPGYQADLVVVDDLRRFRVRQVWHRGRLVAEDGEYLGPNVPPVRLRSSMNVKWLYEKDFRIARRGRRIRAIRIVPGQIVTRQEIRPVSGRDGAAEADPARDLLKLVVIERHRASGRIGKGFVAGLGLKAGAICSTVAHDAHNLISAGCDDTSMFTACVETIKMGGGLCVAEGTRIRARLPLPIGGLMSDRPLREVVAGMDRVLAQARRLGCRLEDPFMTLSFLALPVVPELKLTDRGLIDVARLRKVDLFV